MYERVQNTYSTVKLGVPANPYFNGKKDKMVTLKIDSGRVRLESLSKSSGWVLNLDVCVS